jgi:hypothetical protein
MPNESDLQLFSGGTGPLLRTINVQTYIGGQLTTVQMEVAALSDAQGNIIDLQDASWKRSMLLELTAIRIGLEKQLGENLIDLAAGEVDT